MPNGTQQEVLADPVSKLKCQVLKNNGYRLSSLLLQYVLVLLPCLSFVGVALFADDNAAVGVPDPAVVT